MWPRLRISRNVLRSTRYEFRIGGGRGPWPSQPPQWPPWRRAPARRPHVRPEARWRGSRPGASSGGAPTSRGANPTSTRMPARGGALVGFEVDLAEALARVAGRARALRPERLVDADPVARARHVRRRAQRHRGDARRARRASLHAPVLPLRRAARARGAATRGCAISRRCAGCASARWRTALAWDLLREARRGRRPLRGRRRAVRRPRARAHRRRAARRHHRRALRRRATRRWPPSATSAKDATRSRCARRTMICARRSIARSAPMIASGTWRRTLARWQIDGERQQQLAALGGLRTQGGGRPRRRGPARAHRRRARALPEGALVTLLVSLAAMALAAPLGLALALARLESSRLRGPSRRSTSRSCAARRCCCSSTSSTTAWPACLPLGPFTAAIVGLGLNYAAYEAEIYRAAIAGRPARAVGGGAGGRRVAARGVPPGDPPAGAPPGRPRRDQRLHLAAQGQLAGLRADRRRADQANDDHRRRQPRLAGARRCSARRSTSRSATRFTRLARHLERRLGAHGSA